MSVHVVFMAPRGIGSEDAPGVGNIRAREVVAPGAVSTQMAQPGEIVLVINDTASTVLAAHGSNPDAALTEMSNASSAGFPVIGGRCSPPIMPLAGSKISIKAAA